MAPRRYKKKGKKRSYGRRKKNSYNMALSTRSPFPRMYTTKLRYSEHITLDPGVATIATHQFSCNGLYDPNVSGGGHQPYGFDQLTPLYDHYTVIGAKIMLQFSPGTSATVPYIFGCYIDDNSSPATNYDTVQEIPENNWVVCAIDDTKTLTKKVSLKKFLGIKNLLSSKECQGTDSSNPTEQAYFTLWTKAVDTTVNSPAVNVIVTIDYIAVWHEPKELIGS